MLSVENRILLVLCFCAVVAAKSIGKVKDARDLPDLVGVDNEDLLPKYSGGLGNEYEIKEVPVEFNTTKLCFLFCKNKPTTTEPPLLFPEGDTFWQRSLQKIVERDRNLDHFPVLKQTFGNENFSRNHKKKEASTLDKVGKHIAYIFKPFTNLVLNWWN